MVLAMADYADMKSPYRAGRSHRVAGVAERLARRMSRPEREVVNIHRAALVHDIGIVAVSSFVLNKPRGQLTEGEWEQVRLHPHHSERILSKIPALETLIPMVGAHHERMDGKGYHCELPGSQIPPGARIIAVADRFDDLSHDTSDHAALEPDEVVKLMRPEAGAGLAHDAFEARVEDLSLEG